MSALTIRPLERRDLVSVVALRRRLFRYSQRPSDADLAAYYARVLFENPWYDPDLRSIVLESADGTLAGVLGVIRRPLRLGSRSVTAAVCTEFMVVPEHRGLGGTRLLKRLLNGPQDISLADNANEASRKLFEALGGITATWYSLYWVHPLRPARRMLADLGWTGLLRLGSAALRPLAHAIDWVAARSPGPHRIPAPDGSTEPLEVGAWLELLDRTGKPGVLEPVYDESTLSWLLERLREKPPPSSLRSCQVRDAGGNPVGWFVSYLRRDRVAEIVHFGSLDGWQGLVLEHFIRDAHARKAWVISGRLDAGFASTVQERGYRLQLAEPWTLVHSRDPELLSQVQRGVARLSRLDGEWWLSS